MASNERQNHTVIVTLENRPGALNRVSSLFRRRGFNIESLAVADTEQPGISRLTLVVGGEDSLIEQISKQLYKLIEVLKVTEATETEAVVSELALIKVSATASNRTEILQIVSMFGARVADVSEEALVIEYTGTQQNVDNLLDMLRRFGIKEMVRTGRIAMLRESSKVRRAPAQLTGRERKVKSSIA